MGVKMDSWVDAGKRSGTMNWNTERGGRRCRLSSQSVKKHPGEEVHTASLRVPRKPLKGRVMGDRGSQQKS